MTPLQRDAEKFAQFIVENYPDAKEWDEPVMKAAWYISYGFIAVCCDQGGEIVALVAARPTERPGFGVLPYYFNDQGTCLHIDMWIDVSPDERAMNVFRAFLELRFPQYTTLTMFRHFEEHIRIYPKAKFWRHMEKFKYLHNKKEKAHEPVEAI
jgi:hypothetical protein